MPMTVAAFGAVSASDPLVPMTIERRDPGPRDVRIKIRYAGICHSDIHTVREEWRPITFPQVVGHEIVGEVEAVGSEVTRHRVGDRVGVGCLVNSCRECEPCRAGLEQYCTGGGVGTYASVDRDGTITQGGYSTHIVVDEHFVLRLPEAIPYERAAPLLCAGITPYSPLRHWKIGPGSKVAVVGMGGLGHMGVKFAAALGAEVTVLSHTLSKREDGLAFGAQEYAATSDPETFTRFRGHFDFMLSTISTGFDLDAYLSLLGLGGTLVSIGMPPEPLSVRAGSLSRWKSFASSGIGGIPETQEMLDFCAEHGIAPEVELIAAEQINEAYERVVASDVRYRFVIDVATL
ncbi:NAD(P)-dependent alcohol dehydrogenase [Leucobacter massiliensis]|uniref:alcohol dehydrogenase (NADP(+)) n=1 Tax=Leucobacter massiliensis TaxID=1686285 RepID=A0A2S9QR21_9MICO|nr:NAD(P)-dependent alcohol dehydrogenase [Leucobacter massiliensis]PRI12036.1 alcohol dehydrogenase [Leucobacter massiliensis]